MVAIAVFSSPPAIQGGSFVTNPQCAQSLPANRHLRVVVVDDNYDANATISRLIALSGFEVVERSYDGLSGLNAIKATKPDVAILDIAMPKLDGYSLARRIIDEMESPPRLIAITGFGNESDRPDAAAAGFAAYFRKPVDWRALESTLLGFCHD